jgi:hypothetical protein
MKEVLLALEKAKETSQWVYASELVKLGLRSEDFKLLKKQGLIELKTDESGYTLVRLAEKSS